MNDEELVEQCRRGISSAQRVLYDRYSPMMFGVCLRYASSRDEAQDILQDAFVKVFTKLHTLSKVAALEDWIYHIVVFTAISFLRHKRIRFDKLDDSDFQDPTIKYEPFAASDLLAVIRQLPDNYRLVFNLREVEGYSFEEIAQQLNIEPASARSVLFRAKKMLQEKLKDYGY